jgi:hypothetical protein
MVFDAAGASAAAGGGGLPAGGGSLFQNSHVMLGGGLMLAVGLAAGLLMVVPRVSPLAAGLPGLVLVAWTGLYVADVREAARLIPLASHGFGIGFEVLLFDGLLGMAGLAMTVPLFIPSRWRRAPRVAGNTALGESVLDGDATVPPEMGDPELGGVTAGFARAASGDGAVIIDRTQTLPQRSPVIRPDGSPSPGSVSDQG